LNIAGINPKKRREKIMRCLITLAASALVFSGLALADTFNGRLVDANCTSQDKAAKECDAGANTTAFLLVVDGKALQLDAAGNQKVIEAMKSRADRAADPNSPKKTTVMAKVSGDKEGDTIKVSAVEIQ
jgi:hypothetical protein